MNTPFKIKLHWISYVYPYFLTIIGFIGIFPLIVFRGTFQFIAIGLVFLFFKGIVKIWGNKKTEIYLSNDILSVSTGIFSTTIMDISLTKMEGMQVYQSWLGKLLNFGILVVSTGQISQSYKIENPKELREKILQGINNKQQ